MIISKNNNDDTYNNSLKNNDNFQKNFERLKQNNDLNKPNPFIEDIKTINYSDPTSKKEMRNKTMAMLQERLDQGLITLDEFGKKCNSLSKK